MKLRIFIFIAAIIFCLSGPVTAQEFTKNPKNPVNWEYKPEYGNYINEIKKKLTDPRVTLKEYHHQKFPVLVYIYPMDDKYKALISQVINYYNRYIPMKQTADKNIADVTIQLASLRKLLSTSKNANAQTGGLGNISIMRRNGVFSAKGSVDLLPAALEETYSPRVVAHEIGHALGLAHSSHKEDIMYPTGKHKGLSSRDLNTLWLLYNQW